MKFTNFVLNFLFPEKCGICDKLEDSGICNDCYKKLLQLKETNSEEDKYFLYKYEGIIRNKIIQFKFEDKSYLKTMFANLIKRDIEAVKFINKYEVIVPVPVHFKRYLERGYNQTSIILKELNSKNIVENVLIKRINTKPQSTKNREEREKRTGAFDVNNSDIIKDKKVLVFDDIYTTGNTFEECKRVLIKGGAKEVGALTIAKTKLRLKL